MDDADWFTVMYRRHYDDVERFLRRRAPDVEVADVVATVFMTAWRRIDQVPRRSPLPWLYGVASNTLANEVRSRHRRRQLTDRVRGVTPYDRPADPGTQVADRLLLVALLDDLSAEDLEIVLLIAWEGLSVSDTARVTGRSRTAVAMRIRRLRHRLGGNSARGGAVAKPQDGQPSVREVGDRHDDG